ncbi:MAG: hypothetical protein EBW15_09335, partial [Actinobacteria bacterium]|nr:hypothetical protein [Actinomycetota bacterium]
CSGFIDFFRVDESEKHLLRASLWGGELGTGAVPCATGHRRAGPIAALLGVALALALSAHDSSRAAPSGVVTPRIHARSAASTLNQTDSEFVLVIGDGASEDVADWAGIPPEQLSRSDVELRDGVLTPLSNTLLTTRQLSSLARELGSLKIRADAVKVAPNTAVILPGVSLSLDGEHVIIGGTIDVSGARAGSLTIEASEVVFESTSRVFANGDVGGGNIFVGGEWQGSGALRPAHRIEIAKGARIEASAREEGSGGTVVFWADPSSPTALVDARGHITARGGRRFGDGGRIETSAPRLNVDEIRVDTSPSSTIGRSGTWLIDPRDITISTLTSSNATGVSPFTSTSGLTPANIQASTIVAALATGNVTVSTAGDGPMSGDITVSAEISAGGANKLTLLADGDIILSARIRRTSTGSVDLTATSGVVRGSGNLALSGGTVTLTQGGTNTSGAFYTGAITGTGTSVVKLGSGTLVVSGASNFTGSTTISEGTLKLGAMDKWADDSAVSIASGATLDLNDFDDTVGSISGAGSITLGTGTLT